MIYHTDPQTIHKTTWTETRQSAEGVYTRTVSATEWEFKRTDCFCCSCESVLDPHCRNHGFDGERPCETHEQPGKMASLLNPPRLPESVQKQRALNKMKGKS